MNKSVWLSIILFSYVLVSLLLPRPLLASNTVRFLYDGDGNRVAKIGMTGVTVYFGDSEKNINSNTLTKYYKLGGKKVATKEGNTLSFIGSDHLGSISSLNDTQGSSKVVVRYYPYGQMRDEILNGPSRLFTGQIEDQETDLYYFNARYYNPQNGLFMAADKDINNKFSTLGFNRYIYVNSNPIAFTDPSGMVACYFDQNTKTYKGVMCSALQRQQELASGSNGEACKDGDLGCRIRHGAAALVYQIPIIGPEIVKNELTADEKSQIEFTSAMPGPMAITTEITLLANASRNAQVVLSTYQESNALQGIARALKSGDRKFMSEAISGVQKGIFNKYGTVTRWANEGELAQGIVNERNLGSYLERSNEIILNPAMKQLPPEQFLGELSHEIGATYLARKFSGKAHIPRLTKGYATTHMLDDLMRNGLGAVTQKLGNIF